MAEFITCSYEKFQIISKNNKIFTIKYCLLSNVEIIIFLRINRRWNMILLDDLKARMKQLEKKHMQVLRELEDQPYGHIRLTTCNGHSRYYLRKDPKDRSGQYISKENEELVRALMKKDYLERVRRRIEKEMSLMTRYIAFLEKDRGDLVYSKMSTGRKALVEPVMLTDDELAEVWARQKYKQSTYLPEFKVYPTKRGEMVRSKSEVLLADMFYEMGIPYRYEQVVKTKDGNMYAPDFTLWDKRRRREIYHEHFGLVDDPDYRRDRFLRKIDEYRKSGIFFGFNLTATFEGEGTVLDMNEIRKMFENLLS